ncbi:partitioning defective 3 homolog B [Gadus chalcogrammus]|uniref:partitioning defective 3 homolog B n=1 Tax=Gadus chalcogrammus TaxID=1042646 RepID=UPI0024C49EDB|nr:partitioning defective 3 homolog B [Gadus chalcogrammus]
MKVTVMFGRTGVVVPCREGWTVQDLIQQATQRVRKLLEQDGDFLVRTHHVEYCDGGILDPDDILSDLVEDKDKLMAVYEEKEAQQRGVAGTSPAPSPDLYQSELSVFQPIRGGEIEVNSTALKSSTPLLVRSSSDSMLSPPMDTETPHPEDSNATGSSLVVESSGALERSASKLSFNSSLTRTVEISGEHGPLGIHVVPYLSSLSGRSLGLYIRGVEEESRSRREGLFHEEECIVKINHTHLMDKTFSQAQEVFRKAMRSPLVRLEVVPSSNRERYEKHLIGQLFGVPPATEGSPFTARSKEPLPPVKTKPAFKPTDHPANLLAEEAVTPEPATSKGRCESPLLRKSPALGNLVTNKKGGKRLRIDLKKGVEGLGFTVVTRDSSVHGPGPILVKNILPRGAAVKDGRLQSGDRILEVNGVDIAGVGQEELVCMLRSTRQGECVCLGVLRQDEMFLPRELKEEPLRTPPQLPEDGKEELMLEVALNESGSAGLGVSLKGNKSRHTGADLGIFIKSIIHGGAAYKDGRLRVNDQLVGVNGASLLGRSNHVAMETLRRSMSQEGNLRGTIQLVVLRVQDQHGISSNRSFDSTHGLPGLANQTNGTAHAHMINNSLYSSDVTNGSYSYMDDEEDEELSHRENDLTHGHYREPSLSPSLRGLSYPTPMPLDVAQTPTSPQPQRQYQHVKASKSMDLGTSAPESQQQPVADESNVGSLVSNQTAPSPQVELGPTLGLKKSSSLESLQTAMSEVNKKTELLPFHRPRPNMVRGRGCNESFRAAIDKSYDGPAEEEEEEGSDQSSGRDTPGSSSSHQGAGEQTGERTEEQTEETAPSKKEKNKKNKGKKKEKSQAKGKEKEKKKGEETEETEKKSKKKGFGLLRFGKKKESKAALQRKKTDMLSQEELHIMKDEIERIEAKHPELRDPRAKGDPRPRGPTAEGSRVPGGPRYQEVEDDEADPNYARINSFRDRGNVASTSPATLHSSHPADHGRAPSPPQHPAHPGYGNHGNDPTMGPNGDPMDGLYAKVNKPRGGASTAAAVGPSPPPAHAGAGDSERIQLLRREYQQARREGMTPAYEDPDPRRRGPDDDTHRIPVRGVEHRTAPRYEEVERQYASLPRRGPLDPVDYPMQPWSGPYPGAPPPTQGYPQPGPGYPGPNPQPGQAYPGYPPGQPYPRSGDLRSVEPGYYPHQKGPLRQDVPPSPPLRAQRYDTMSRVPGGGAGAYRNPREPVPDQYGYLGDGGKRPNQPNPRQKNPMTAAV